MAVTIYGASDDLIEVEGDVKAEFQYNPRPGSGQYIALSCGVVLSIEYDNDGVWRINPVCVAAMPAGTTLSVEQAPADDEVNYSDRATVTGAEPVSWVVIGDDLAKNKSG